MHAWMSDAARVGLSAEQVLKMLNFYWHRGIRCEFLGDCWCLSRSVDRHGHYFVLRFRLPLEEIYRKCITLSNQIEHELGEFMGRVMRGA